MNYPSIHPDIVQLIEKLASTHSLELSEYKALLDAQSGQTAQLLADYAVEVRKKIYGNSVFIRGLIEVSSFCKNDCLYCGLRASNRSCDRYRLSAAQILSCANLGYELGFRTFVLQGGEDPYFSDEATCAIVSAIKEAHPDCAITLSLGERSRASYQALFDAGADRYLLRHEAADSRYYSTLHPASMNLASRMNCLSDLRKVGFAVGAGFMVGAPGQTTVHIAADLKFIEEFKPDMCGIGPFIPHHATPFAHESAGTVEQTCYLLSIIRLIHPSVLLPSTTALASIDSFGRERGILAGANVVMPNLSPSDVRSKYELYNNKASYGVESAEGLAQLNKRCSDIGYRIVVDRGDPIHR